MITAVAVGIIRLFEVMVNVGRSTNIYKATQNYGMKGCCNFSRDNAGN